MKKLAVVVVGYNRIQGLKRALNSLENANYNGEKITLIVSMDNCGDKSVAECAKSFSWSHGEIRVRTFTQRQGLRKHILSCGEYLNEFDAIAVIEDDVVVAPGFYEYMKQAVEFYCDNERIAGISLYSHKVNVNANAPFVPQPGASDIFFMQFAQSWGQVWMKRQWFEFKSWYLENKDEPFTDADVPNSVSNWPKTSWLKYHIKYCIKKDKYFVYPYDSMATCFSDVGEHCKEENIRFQVPISLQTRRDYRFAELSDDSITYDAFFERTNIGSVLQVSNSDVCMDLYGTKNNSEGKRYWVSLNALPYKTIFTFGMEMRPHESNIYNKIIGEEIRVYDTQVKAESIKSPFVDYSFVNYYYNIVSEWKKIVGYLWIRILKNAKK